MPGGFQRIGASPSGSLPCWRDQPNTPRCEFGGSWLTDGLAVHVSDLPPGPTLAAG